MNDESKIIKVFYPQFLLISFLLLSLIILSSGCINLTGESHLSNTLRGPMDMEFGSGGGSSTQYFSINENYDRIFIIGKLIKGELLWINITNTGELRGPDDGNSNSSYTSILSSDWLNGSQSYNSTYRYVSTKLENGNYFISLKNYGDISIIFRVHVYLE